MYTTALALTRLGPTYKFRTQLRTTTALQPNQHVLADLLLLGGGDPNLSGRVVPYLRDSKEVDPLIPLKELAADLSAAGVTEIEGDVTGASTRYSDPYPDGWTLDDTLYGYGAPVTALAFNDNAITLTLRPSEVGELAEIELRPAVNHFVISDHVTTIESKQTGIEITRPAGSNELILRGSIGNLAPEWHQDVAVEDPALFAAEALIGVLGEAGIAVSGSPRSLYCAAAPCSPPPETVLATRESAPLSQEIQVINKVSQNLHAEMLLRECGFFARGNGSLSAGVAERQSFLQQILRDAPAPILDDGSGLARHELTTPAYTVALLRHMWARPDRDVWLQSLPIGGFDGSLEHRFKTYSGAYRVHAKTGSHSHVNTLSGYLEPRRGGHWLAFSVMADATVAPDSDVRDFIDRLCELVLSQADR